MFKIFKKKTATVISIEAIAPKANAHVEETVAQICADIEKAFAPTPIKIKPFNIY